MCTVVVLVRRGHPYPVLLAANRDERLNRSWDPPAIYWPGVVGGRDRTAGGTWMAINRHGVVAAILNRAGTLGPVFGKRSRGELPLLALTHASARDAAAAIGELDAGEWRGFNMVVADRSGAVFVRGLGHGKPDVEALPEGVSMITAYDPNDLGSPRVARHLPRLQAAEPDGPDDWRGWRAILSDRAGHAGEQINVVPRGGFGTASSSFVAIPGQGSPVWLFAAGPPHQADFEPVQPP
ncbi:NRDE family protein [Rhodopila sp.]|uniref:NRDE family protein n=1 Tax=Rhodopila sp. TaxID=2480087 RepID=UPI003D13CEF9